MADVFVIEPDSVIDVVVPEPAVTDVVLVGGPAGPTGATGPIGATGSTGAAATVTVGTVTTAEPGATGAVSNSGTPYAAVLDFTVPRGATGSTGPVGNSGTITVGYVTTGGAGSTAAVVNTGTANDAIFNFTIPRGDTGGVGSTGPRGETGAQGLPGISLDIQGTQPDYASLLALTPTAGDAWIVNGLLYYFDGVMWPADGQGVPFQGSTGPRGDTGAAGSAASIAVGNVYTGVPGSTAVVTNTGTSSAAVFDFTLPRGDVGATGSVGATGATGSAATVSVGTTTTGAVGSTASVSNSGSSSAAVFNFTIPRGDTGPTGATGSDATVTATNVASVVTGATSKATPVDADELPLVDSAASNVLKKLTWANLKATVAAYYDSLTSTLSNKTIAAPALTGTTKVAQSGTVELYNTSDQTTNFEKTMFRYNANTFEINNTFAGTGTAIRSFRFGVSSLVNSPSFTRYIDINGNAPFVNLATVNTSSVGNLYTVMSGASSTAASGTVSVFCVVPTINQSGTASYTALLINPTETATGSGTKRLIDAQVGGTTKFNVDNVGNAVANSHISSTTSTATAAGTTTLTNSSTQVQVFTGTTTQTVKLPTTGVLAGQQFTIVNQSTGSVTVQSSGGNTVATVTASTVQLFIAIIATPTAAEHWRAI